MVTNAFSSSIPDLISLGGSVAAASAGFLIWVAWVMGKKFDQLVATGEIVGGEAEVGFQTYIHVHTVQYSTVQMNSSFR